MTYVLHDLLCKTPRNHGVNVCVYTYIHIIHVNIFFSSYLRVFVCIYVPGPRLSFCSGASQCYGFECRSLLQTQDASQKTRISQFWRIAMNLKKYNESHYHDNLLDGLG